MNLEQMRIKIFADGADLVKMAALAKNPLIKGFTTNPTLMRQAAVGGYEQFAKSVLWVTKSKPISFEVVSDDFNVMARQARTIAGWGPNVYVKIPVVNSKGESAEPLIRKLSKDMHLNITAIMTTDQVASVADCICQGRHTFLSVFAGRIADTGRDPVPIMATALRLVSLKPFIQLIWASPRELLNLFQAEDIGCHVITMTPDLLRKLPLVGKPLHEYSRETAEMFHRDAQLAGYTL